MAGFWVRPPTWSSASPGRSWRSAWSALVPLAVVGARTRSNYSQLADLDPDRPSVVGARSSGVTSPSASSARPRSWSRTRRWISVAPGRAAIAAVSRRLEADRPRRRGPLALPAAGQAAGRPAGQGLLRQRVADPASGSRPTPDTSASGPPSRPTPTTSPGSTSSSRPTPSPRRASRPSIGCARPSWPPRRPVNRWRGAADRIGLAGSTSAVNDLRKGHDRRPAADVRPGHARGLRDPGHPAPPSGHLPVPDRDGGPRLPRLAGIDRPGLPRVAPRARALGRARLEGRLLPLRDPRRRGRGLQHLPHGPGRSRRSEITGSPRGPGWPWRIPAGSSARAA